MAINGNFLIGREILIDDYLPGIGRRQDGMEVSTRMETDRDISQLERIVEKMIAGYQRLKEEKEAVEKDLKELQETVEAMKSEKASVHKRVLGLIQSIEKIEQLEKTDKIERIEKIAQAKGEDEGVPAPSHKQTPIFSIGS